MFVFMWCDYKLSVLCMKLEPFNSTEVFWVSKGQIGVWDLSERSNKINDYHFQDHQDCCDQQPCFSVMEGWENTVVFFKKKNRLKESNLQVLRLVFVRINRNTHSLHWNKYQWGIWNRYQWGFCPNINRD